MTGGAIVGVFLLVQAPQPPLLEFLVLRQVSGGLELRIRHFDPKLKPMEGVDPIVMRFVEHDGSRFVFANPVNARPKRSVLERRSEGWFHSRSEIIEGNGSRSTIEVDWHRRSLDLLGPSLASRTALPKDDIARLAWFAGHWRSALEAGEVHEFWLGPRDNVMAGALCPVHQGKVEGCEFSSLSPEAGVLVGRTWQLGPDLKIPAEESLIEASVVGGTGEGVDFRGTIHKDSFTERVEQAGPGRMHKKLEIYKPDGSRAAVIELHGTRVAPKPTDR